MSCQIWSTACNGGQPTGSSCRKCEYHFVDSVALPLTLFLLKGSQVEVKGPAQGDSESLSVPPNPVIRAETPLAINPLEQLDLTDLGCLDDTWAEVRDGQHSEPRVHRGSDDAVLYSAPPIPAGILSFLWNSSGIPVECTGIYRNDRNSTGIPLDSTGIPLE